MRSVKRTKKSFFGIHDIEGVRLLTRLRVHFRDLREHRFRNRFQCSSPMCICQTGSEDNEHFFLPCPRDSNHRRDLLNRISDDIDLGNLSSTVLCNLSLYHPLQRVKAEWNGDFRFGRREEYRSFSRSFKKPFVFDTFQAISTNFLNSRHMKMNTEGMRPLDV